MTDQIGIPAAYMRGGTSKGLLFDKKDLPSEINKVFINCHGISRP